MIMLMMMMRGVKIIYAVVVATVIVRLGCVTV